MRAALRGTAPTPTSALRFALRAEKIRQNSQTVVTKNRARAHTAVNFENR